MAKHGHEQLVLFADESAGLRGAIAIHDTTLGPALGGCRMWTHPTEEAAIMDVLRLSRAMTYKSAAAGLNLGGGKALILGDPRKDRSEALFRALGRQVEALGGRYVTTEDVGTTSSDMQHIAKETRFVTGLPIEEGGSGDPSVVTGYGVYMAMKACAQEVWGTDDLSGKTVALQGLGKVASNLIEHLKKEEARLIGTDISEERVRWAAETHGVRPVAPDDIFGVETDIFAPCALGGVLNDRTIPLLRCQVVCGGANNQLLEDRHGEELHRRGILYAPDYIVNAGGVINLSFEIGRPYSREAALRKTAEIYATMAQVIATSKQEKTPTSRAADRLAEARIAAVRDIRMRLGEARGPR
ncbi:MAG: Glu/Leu/Phe/Val dehydrogenase [Chloroflexi bacterium]|nr:Glu/Leu/Phe/Val dehydrogenase [Chloroflexota bacterium]